MFTRYGIPIRKGLAEKWFSRAIQEADLLNVAMFGITAYFGDMIYGIKINFYSAE